MGGAVLVSRHAGTLSMTAPIDLEARDVVRSFGSFRAVRGVSFEIPKGSFFSILGPSGCGKTTLLRMIAGFLEPDAGDILIGGRSMIGVPPNRRPPRRDTSRRRS